MSHPLRFLFLFVALMSAAPASARAQGANDPLPPHAVEGGVRFECVAPTASRVFLAGTFNNWADNRKGVVADERYLMTPVAGRPGVFQATVRLDPGRHRFRFVLDTGVSGQVWFAPPRFAALEHRLPGGRLEVLLPQTPGRDAQNNIILTLSPSGRVFLGNGVSPDLAPQVANRKVTFRYWAPEAASVHLAGNFNEWARNREGLVSDPAYLFSGPDEDGVWTFVTDLPAGDNRYQFVVDGREWRTDPNAPAVDNRHGILIVR